MDNHLSEIVQIFLLEQGVGLEDLQGPFPLCHSVTLPQFRSVSNAGSEISRRVWTPSPPPHRPFRVCDHKRNIRKGLMASTLEDLLNKARETLLLSGLVFLVLEEDGTLIETEEFFQILEDNTALMVLQKGQKWTHGKSISRSFSLSGDKPRNSKDIARITFDVYKLNPRDLFGSLNISATFYGLYSMSCDFKCLGPKKVLRAFQGQLLPIHIKGWKNLCVEMREKLGVKRHFGYYSDKPLHLQSMLPFI
uniref:Cell death inducing DFFA like effector b n=1 Tax=Naja naja TaxID=35670 RepID=A0A8C7E2V1_NAJNA